MKKTPVILDCDNTYGIHGCDVDDGLALLYLLGCPDAEVLGITCSFGNSTQEIVYDNTIRLLKDWGIENIPVYKGSYFSGEEISDAAHFLAETAEKLGGSLRILCTGSTSNLASAAKINENFYSQIGELSMMGGLTEPLFVGGRPMNELNFSCDSPSSLQVLKNVKNIKIACAAHCLDSYFSADELDSELDSHPGLISDYLRETLKDWYDFNRTDWNISGIVNWDVMAAAQMMHPELFELNPSIISPTEESMASGFLHGGGDEIRVFLPRIKDRKIYTFHVYDRYFSASVSPKINAGSPENGIIPPKIDADKNI